MKKKKDKKNIPLQNIDLARYNFGKKDAFFFETRELRAKMRFGGPIADAEIALTIGTSKENRDFLFAAMASWILNGNSRWDGGSGF